MLCDWSPTLKRTPRAGNTSAQQRKRKAHKSDRQKSVVVQHVPGSQTRDDAAEARVPGREIKTSEASGKNTAVRVRSMPVPMRVAHSTGVIDNPKCHQPHVIRIVVVDDYPIFRVGLTQLLNSESEFAVCGEASNAGEAMDVIRKIRPGLVVVALGLKGPNGLEFIKTFRVEFPKTPAIILSRHNEATYAVRSLRAGANAFIIKGDEIGSLLAAVYEVMAGRVYLSPSIASDVITKLLLQKGNPGSDPTDNLTDRELEVLERIGHGEEVKAIAEALRLSPKTVETHRMHIKEKLNLKNAHDVARFAVRWVGVTGV